MKFRFIVLFISVIIFNVNAQVAVIGITSTLGICVGNEAEIPPIILKESNIDDINTQNPGIYSFQIAPPSGFSFVPNIGQIKSDFTKDVLDNFSINISSNQASIVFNNLYNRQVPFTGGTTLNSWVHLNANTTYMRNVSLFSPEEIGSTGIIRGLSYFCSGNTNNTSPKIFVKIYIKNTTITAINTSTFNDFNHEISQSVLVYSGEYDAAAHRVNSWYNLDFNVGNYNYSTLVGENLQVIFETDYSASNPGQINAPGDNLRTMLYQAISPAKFGYSFSNSSFPNAPNAFNFRPYVRFRHSITPEVSIDAITISGLRVEPSSVSSGQIRRVSGTLSINGLNLSTPLQYLGSRNSVGILTGIENNYCLNSGVDTVGYFPSGGVFSLSPFFPNLISTLSGSNKLVINPTQLNTLAGIQDISITYNFPDVANDGCTVTSRNFRVNPLPTVQLNVQSIKADISDVTPIRLDGIVTQGVSSGNYEYNGEGVYSNNFYPFLVSDIGYKEIFFKYTSPLGGCVSTATSNIYVSDNKKSFTFQKTSNLDVLSFTGMPSFCVDDYEAYKISMNTVAGLGITPEQFNVLNPLDTTCKRSHSYRSIPDGISFNNFTTNGYGFGVLNTLGSTVSGVSVMNNFIFVPSLAGVGLFNIYYAYDEGVPNTGCALRTSPIAWTQNQINTRQPVSVKAIPESPKLVFSDTSFCQGALPNFTVQTSSTATGAVFSWQQFNGSTWENVSFVGYSNTLSGLTLNQLGLSNLSPLGQTNYRVRQNVEGCWSPYTNFSIRIKPVPAAPVVTFANGKPSYCLLESISILLSINTLTGTTFDWYDNQAGNNPISNSNLFSPVVRNDIPASYDIYAIQTLNGCKSNIISSVVGVGITRVNIIVNSLPGWGGLENQPVVNKYCKNEIISNIVLTVASSLVSTVNGEGFRWYTDAFATSLVGNGFGNTAHLGGNVVQNSYNSQVQSSIVGINNFYVRLRTDAGCLSSTIRRATVEVIDIPQKPSIVNVPDDTLSGRRLCFNGLQGTNSLQVFNPLTGVSYRWYNSLPLIPANIVFTSLGTNFPLSILGSFANTTVNTNLYVTQSREICEGDYQQVNISIKPKVPNANVIANTYYCVGRTIPPLSATGISGGSVNWFNKVGNQYNLVLNNSETYFLPGNTNASTVTSFVYVRQRFDDCDSDLDSLRIEVRATPSNPIGFDTAYCTGNQIRPLQAKAGSLPNRYFRWFSSTDTTSNFLSMGTTTTVGAQIYSLYTSSITGSIALRQNFWVNQISNGCPSNLTQVNLQVFEVPSQPTSFSPSPLCSGAPLPSLSAQGTQVRWYITTTTSASVTGSSFTTSNFSNIYVNTIQWVSAATPPFYQFVYVTQTTNRDAVVGSYIFRKGCESGFKVDTIRYNPFPPAPPVAQPSPYCSGATINNVTTTGVSPLATISWFRRDVSSLITTGGICILSNGIINNNVSVFETTPVLVNQQFNGCTSNNSIINIAINPLPQPQFTSQLKDKYCIYDNIVTVSAEPTIAGISTITSLAFGGIYSITGVSNSTTTGPFAFINPANTNANASVPGLVNVWYRYVDVNGCENTISTSFNVNARPIISFTAPDSGYCNQQGAFNLIASPSNGGFFKGSGVSGRRFLPLQAGVGQKTLTFVYTDPSTGCIDSIQRNTKVYPLPQAKFSISSRCFGDLARFTDESSVEQVESAQLISQSVIRKRKWTFNTVDTANTLIASYTYPGVGSFRTKLEVESSAGCKIEIDSVFAVGPNPIPDFSWSNICQGNTTDFVSTSQLEAGDIIKYAWLIDGQIVETTSTGLSQKIQNFGSNLVVLTVTSDQNCMKSIEKEVNILPSLTLKSSFFESFNDDNGGWFAEGKNNNWTYGQANKTYIKTGASDKVWFTNSTITSNYSRGQSAWVYSPCFDISALDKPMIVFNYSSYLYKDDGVVLQVSTNSGFTWQNLGEIGTGIDWFNKTNIFGNPGEQRNFKNGWSFHDGVAKWREARHSLNEVVAAKNIRLRFAIGSTADQVPLSDATVYDGFGFDNVWIGNRNKKGLIEQFTNTNIDDFYKNKIDNVINSRQNDVVGLKYHTSFPRADEFNLANSADPSSRVLYYGVQLSPRSIFDGNVFNVSTDLVDNSKIDLRSLQTAKFSIVPALTVANNSAKVDVSVVADTAFADSSLILQIALIERFVDHNGKKYESVLRKLLPDASGTLIKQSWNKGTRYTTSQSWNLTGVANQEELEAVVFLQNQLTKEIYQVGYTGEKFEYATSVETTPTNEVSIVPNPTDSYTDLVFTDSQSKLTITLTDALGKTMLIREYENEKRIRLNIEGFSSGIYYLTVVRNGKAFSQKIIKY